MARPVLATIHGDALKHNLDIVRLAAPGVCVWSVVKANAYGHGLARSWQSLSATNGFALLNLEEAILLRNQGWKKPILLLEGFFSADELLLIDRYRLTTSVHSNWQIKALAQAKLSAPVDIYVKVNSGMNRLGFPPEQLYNVWQKLRCLSNIGEMTVMAHFAEADKPQGITTPLPDPTLSVLNAVLTGFSLNYGTDDYHVAAVKAQVGAGQNGREGFITALAYMNDASGDQAQNPTANGALLASSASSPGLVIVPYTAQSQDAQTIQLPIPVSSAIALLTSFQVQFPDGDDHHVLTIGAGPNACTVVKQLGQNASNIINTSGVWSWMYDQDQNYQDNSKSSASIIVIGIPQ